MTLFDECKEALFSDFHLLIGDEENKAIDLLNKYPITPRGVVWNEMEYSDYDNFYDVLNVSTVKNQDVFVLTDNADIPIFRTNIKLVAENVYDVTALSPKLFIYNNEIIIQPLFPSERFRVGSRPGRSWREAAGRRR
ncbi:hypothetical protein DBY66_006470 [Pantoea sp. RIT413]|uniref:CDI toxin immunity protein n=1 Tax=Pantoea sp. RIT413 TaxID=2202162 RepID=UPI000D3C0D97|nr:hypothetical protein [Pantoea sp. RIT 413]RAU32962.1 hypothetical protein DBY66_006470 [Pantoea sp. RIT 413]